MKTAEIISSNVLFPLRLFADIAGSDMKRVNLYDFYIFGNRLEKLRHLTPGNLTTFNCGALNEANIILGMVCREAEFNIIPLEDSKRSAQNLLNKTQALLNKIMRVQFSSNEPSNEIDIHEIIDIHSALDKFEILFSEESRKIATFYVTKKRNYSTQGLIENADNEFPDAVKKRLSKQAIFDIKSAGRAIAFELTTASGIHSFRALEAVALDYLDKRKLTPPKRDLFTYFDMLQKDGADEKVIQIGQQLRNLRRNPLAHPEDNLDTDEAIEAFQLCSTAITALVKDMEKRGLFPS